ncbi:ProQ/FINO family protein [Cupriavidus basilensis]
MLCHKLSRSTIDAQRGRSPRLRIGWQPSLPHVAPLAGCLGIFEDLLPHAQERALTEAELREAIKTWCRGARYWACLIEGGSRMDLAGQEVGQVRPEDAKRAQQLQARRAPQARSKPSKA